FGIARDIWNGVSSLLMVAGLFWISQRLRNERRRIGALVAEFASELNDKINVTTELAKSARNSAEAAAAAIQAHAPPQSPSPGSGLPDMHRNWQHVRDRIDHLVTSIKHPHLRKKYAGFSRDSYHDIIHALRMDGHIPHHAAEALANMNNRILALKTRPADHSENQIREFQNWLTIADAALPPHPHDDVKSGVGMP
ncbi:MAG: hypothetical protein KDK27_20205, partial [Leptospiraceae bacterium]|nr:hypothetical protein [Leptospiraceae bacterium]